MFFSKKEKEAILLAIKTAEKRTSGEIRLHLEKKKSHNVEARAREIFEKIGMTKTAAKNGVLIYLNTGTRQFVLLGDTGIHAKVPQNFWQEIAAQMTASFKADRFAEGLVTAIMHTGNKLKTFFPFEVNDKNELSDEISYS